MKRSTDVSSVPARPEPLDRAQDRRRASVGEPEVEGPPKPACPEPLDRARDRLKASVGKPVVEGSPSTPLRYARAEWRTPLRYPWAERRTPLHARAERVAPAERVARAEWVAHVERVLVVLALLVFFCSCSSVQKDTIAKESSPSAASPQSNVDRVAQALENSATVPQEDWKLSPAFQRIVPDGGAAYWAAFAGDPRQRDFDDSSWKTFKAGEPIDLEACWLRKLIVLPQRVLGQPMSGSVKLHLTFSGTGELWVDGTSQGRQGAHDVELTKEAKPGQTFLVAIRASQSPGQGNVHRPGPIRLTKAELILANAEPTRKQIEDFALSLRVAQKLLSFDTYQTNARAKADPGIDKSQIDKAERIRLNDLLQKLAGQIDVAALADGSLDRFNASVAAVRAQLAPLRDFVQRFTLYFDANAHIDAAWLWREKETVEVVKNTFSSVLNMMNA